MNIPGITKALELDDEDWQLAVKLRGLSEHQREQFSAALGPAKPQKKSSKKGGGKSASKSPRASGMAAAISNSLESSRKATVATDDNDSDSGLCIVGIDSKGETCDQPADANVHHLSTHADYHEFKPWEKPVTTAASGD